MEDLTDVVYQTLDGPDPLGGWGWSGASTSMGSGFWGLPTPGFERASVHWDPVIAWDPTWGSSVGEASRGWDLAASSTLGSSTGSRY
jgi:hypothetical protein